MLGVIINPKSGGATLRRKVLYLFRSLRREQIAFVYKQTKYSFHAKELAQGLVESGIRQLLVVGGDGTLSEVIDGVMHAKIDEGQRRDIEIGLIPSGTGNDWGRYWSMSKNYKQEIEAYLHSSRKETVDIGRLRVMRNGREEECYFINSIGFGIDAKTVQRAEVMKYYVGSHGLNYFLGLLLALFSHKPLPVRLITDSGLEINDSLFTMNIANGPYSGGGIKQNPDADPQDGILHAMFVSRLTARLIREALPNLFNGRLKDIAFIKYFTAKQIEIVTNQHIVIEKDGIIVNACGPYRIDIMPAALKMVVPQR